MPGRGKTAHVRAACAYVVLALALAGCSGDDPEPTPPPSSPARATEHEPSPPPESPEPPATLGQLDLESAVDFAHYFVDLYEYAYSTGDLTDWERLSHASCQFCSAVADEVRAETEAGHVSRGGGIRLESVSADAISPEFVKITARASQDAATVHDREGNLVREAAAEELDVTVAVEAVDGAWRFRELEISEDGA